MERKVAVVLAIMTAVLAAPAAGAWCAEPTATLSGSEVTVALGDNLLFEYSGFESEVGDNAIVAWIAPAQGSYRFWLDGIVNFEGYVTPLYENDFSTSGKCWAPNNVHRLPMWQVDVVGGAEVRLVVSTEAGGSATVKVEAITDCHSSVITSNAIGMIFQERGSDVGDESWSVKHFGGPRLDGILQCQTDFEDSPYVAALVRWTSPYAFNAVVQFTPSGYLWFMSGCSVTTSCSGSSSVPPEMTVAPGEEVSMLVTYPFYSLSDPLSLSVETIRIVYACPSGGVIASSTISTAPFTGAFALPSQTTTVPPELDCVMVPLSSHMIIKFVAPADGAYEFSWESEVDVVVSTLVGQAQCHRVRSCVQDSQRTGVVGMVQGEEAFLVVGQVNITGGSFELTVNSSCDQGNVHGFGSLYVNTYTDWTETIALADTGFGMNPPCGTRLGARRTWLGTLSSSVINYDLHVSVYADFDVALAIYEDVQTCNQEEPLVCTTEVYQDLYTDTSAAASTVIVPTIVGDDGRAHFLVVVSYVGDDGSGPADDDSLFVYFTHHEVPTQSQQPCSIETAAYTLYYSSDIYFNLQSQGPVYPTPSCSMVDSPIGIAFYVQQYPLDSATIRMRAEHITTGHPYPSNPDVRIVVAVYAYEDCTNEIACHVAEPGEPVDFETAYGDRYVVVTTRDGQNQGAISFLTSTNLDPSETSTVSQSPLPTESATPVCGLPVDLLGTADPTFRYWYATVLGASASSSYAHSHPFPAVSSMMPSCWTGSSDELYQTAVIYTPSSVETLYGTVRSGYVTSAAMSIVDRASCSELACTMNPLVGEDPLEYDILTSAEFLVVATFKLLAPWEEFTPSTSIALELVTGDSGISPQPSLGPQESCAAEQAGSTRVFSTDWYSDDPSDADSDQIFSKTVNFGPNPIYRHWLSFMNPPPICGPFVPNRFGAVLKIDLPTGYYYGIQEGDQITFTTIAQSSNTLLHTPEPVFALYAKDDCSAPLACGNGTILYDDYSGAVVNYSSSLGSTIYLALTDTQNLGGNAKVYGRVGSGIEHRISQSVTIRPTQSKSASPSPSPSESQSLSGSLSQSASQSQSMSASASQSSSNLPAIVGDPIIVDIHGHRFAAGKEPNTAFLLYKDAKGIESIAAKTGDLSGFEGGFFVMEIEIYRQGCGSISFTADQSDYRVQRAVSTTCMDGLWTEGDNGLVVYSLVDNSAVMLVFPHHNAIQDMTFLNVKFAGVTTSFATGCTGMLCSERHDDIVFL